MPEKRKNETTLPFIFVLQAVSECLKSASGELENDVRQFKYIDIDARKKRDFIKQERQKHEEEGNHKKRNFKYSCGFLYMKKVGNHRTKKCSVVVTRTNKQGQKKANTLKKSISENHSVND